MKQSEIESKIGAKVDSETIRVVSGRKVVSAKLIGATLDDNFKPVLSYAVEEKKEVKTAKK